MVFLKKYIKAIRKAMKMAKLEAESMPMRMPLPVDPSSISICMVWELPWLLKSLPEIE